MLDSYRKLADDFGSRVNSVPDAAWDNQSPCPEWKARDVVAHVAGVARHFVSVASGTPEPTDAPDDVKAAWTVARAEVEAALADPDRAAAVVESPFGPMPFEQLVGNIVCVDMLVHTWDLARAAGLDERLDQGTVAHAFEALKPLDANLRGPGLFAPAVEPPAGADQQTQFLSFLGRKV
jgi:uncharacterized protein (TIGR03086 family)